MIYGQSAINLFMTGHIGRAGELNITGHRARDEN